MSKESKNPNSSTIAKILIGAAVIFVLIFFFGAKLKSIQIGPFGFEIPIQAVASETASSIQAVASETASPIQAMASETASPIQAAASGTASPIQVGRLRWELRDKDGNIIASDDNWVYDKDIVTQKAVATDGTIYYEKSILLTGNFFIGISDFPISAKSQLGGFGMWLMRTDVDTSSWDWFDIIDDKTANKLQGGGQLGYALEIVDSKWQIARITFLTDIVLRTNTTESMTSEPTWHENPTWTVKILQDSFINWIFNQ